MYDIEIRRNFTAIITVLNQPRKITARAKHVSGDTSRLKA